MANTTCACDHQLLLSLLGWTLKSGKQWNEFPSSVDHEKGLPLNLIVSVEDGSCCSTDSEVNFISYLSLSHLCSPLSLFAKHCSIDAIFHKEYLEATITKRWDIFIPTISAVDTPGSTEWPPENYHWHEIRLQRTSWRNGRWCHVHLCNCPPQKINGNSE